MLRLLLYFIVFYVFWRIVRSVLSLFIGPAPKKQSFRTQRRHAPDFSDVPEADFEDITPPREEKRDSSTSTPS